LDTFTNISTDGLLSTKPFVPFQFFASVPGALQLIKIKQINKSTNLLEAKQETFALEVLRSEKPERHVRKASQRGSKQQ